MRVSFTIQGEPASKANRRRLVHFHGRTRFVKSTEALAFEAAALLQIPISARVMYAGPVRVTLRLFYRTNRPDLDESIVLDCLQARYAAGGRTRGLLSRPGVIVNDRQVKEKHVYHGIDAAAPRVEVEVEALELGDQEAAA